MEEFVTEKTAVKIGLSWVLSAIKPLSPYGKQLKSGLKARQPGCEAALSREWSLVASFARGVDAEEEITPILADLREIRGAVRRACQGAVLKDMDLFEINRFLALSRRLGALVAGLEFLPPRMAIPAAVPLAEALAPGGQGAGFYLADGFSPALARWRRELRGLKAALSKGQKAIEAGVSEETGLSFDAFGRLRVAKLDPRGERLKGRQDVILLGESYTELEFSIAADEELQALQKRAAELEARSGEEEYKVRRVLSRQVAANCRTLLAACYRIGRLDLLMAKGRLAAGSGWCIPQLTEERAVVLEGFVNPAVDHYLAAGGKRFQPLSISLGDPVTVITGANMGGKSVALASLGLACGMAQYGLLAPAKSFRFSLRDFIYCSQQDEDTSQGLSAFGAEISGLARVLPLRQARGLYLLDEPGRGTNPEEGAALVKAMAAWLREGESLTLVATHFPGVAAMAGVAHYQMAGLAASGLEDRVYTAADIGLLAEAMDYSLVPGRGQVPRAALMVAGLLGLDPEIIAGAAAELGTEPRSDE